MKVLIYYLIIKFFIRIVTPVVPLRLSCVALFVVVLFCFPMYVFFFLLFLVTKHKGTEKRESPSPAPKPRKVELSESGKFLWVGFFLCVC